MNEPTRLLTPRGLAGLLAAAAVLLTPATATAQTRSIDVDTALRTAMRHPDLCAAAQREHEARARVLAEEDLRPVRFGADVGARHQRVPTLALGGVTTPTTDSVAVGADIDKTFAWGTQVGVRVESRYQRSAIPVAPGASQQLELGPGYGITARLSVAQPLLRGAGSELGEAELRARRSERQASHEQRRQRRRAVLRDTLIAYYELWFAGEQLVIERAASGLADQELQAARARVEVGALAPSFLSTHLTQRAERREVVVAAELALEQRARQLALRMGAMDVGSLRASAAPPLPPLMGRRALTHTLERALRSSPALAVLEAERKAGQQRLRLAGEADRTALDLTGWVQGDGLGHRAASPALRQLGSFSAVSAQIGLRVETPVTGSRHDAQRAAARANLAAIAARQAALRQAIETDARLLVQRASSTRRRLTLAGETVDAARAELQATRERHHAGEAIALEVQRAIDALRRAELRLRRLRVDWASADVALREITGGRLTGRRLPTDPCR
jgi:outer membrane protein